MVRERERERANEIISSNSNGKLGGEVVVGVVGSWRGYSWHGCGWHGFRIKEGKVRPFSHS